MHPLNPAFAATLRPPVMEARRWLEGADFPLDRPLLNVSQAAPTDPPPEALRRAIAEASLWRDDAHIYGAVLGNPDLRQAVATDWSEVYGARIESRQVAITQGGNQAFCAAIATLAGAGDEVLMPAPWYFNHKMWLDMEGVITVPVPCDDAMLPDPEAMARLINPCTRALALVTPNNPTGAEYSPALMRRMFDLCRDAGIGMVVDETYRDFHSQAGRGIGAPHDLLHLPNWDETLVQLYSFSKAYRLTGHRVGVLIGSPERLIEVEKWLDTVAICGPQLGQIGALYGIRHLRDWLAAERAEILTRRAAALAALGTLEGWRLRSCGAYFAWLEHPFAESSADIAPRLVREAGVLALPGTMFVPESDPQGARHFRVAFANIDANGIISMGARLAGFQG